MHFVLTWPKILGWNDRKGRLGSGSVPRSSSSLFCLSWETSLIEALSISVTAPRADCFPRGDAHPLLCIYSENRSPGSRPHWVRRCCFDWPFGALECVKLCVLIGQSLETAFHLLFCGGDWPPGPAVPLQISWPSTSLRGNTTLTLDQSLWTFGSFPTKCLISDLRTPSFPLFSLQSLTCFSICIIHCDRHYNLACIL